MGMTRHVHRDGAGIAFNPHAMHRLLPCPAPPSHLQVRLLSLQVLLKLVHKGGDLGAQRAQRLGRLLGARVAALGARLGRLQQRRPALHHSLIPHMLLVLAGAQARHVGLKLPTG